MPVVDRSAASHRLLHLDGLRFAAVLSVALYHYLYRWTPPAHPVSLYPYGSAFAGGPVAKYGWLGVELFFIISGFVIALTLARCRTFGEFAARRYARLAPAMLVFSLLTFVILNVIPGSPFHPEFRWMLSSVTFLDPEDLNLLVDKPLFGSMDGAYWSLYVEVKFYVIAAIAYFLLGRNFRWGMCVLAAVAVAFSLLQIPLLSFLADRLLIAKYLPWFVIGIGFYLRYSEPAGADSWIVIATGVVLLVALAMKSPDGPPLLAALLVPAFFWICTESSLARRILSFRPIAMVGAASYSLYLIHQSVGVTLINLGTAIGSTAPGAVLLVGGVLLLMGIVATVSFARVEQPLSRRLLRALLPRARNAGIDNK